MVWVMAGAWQAPAIDLIAAMIVSFTTRGNTREHARFTSRNAEFATGLEVRAQELCGCRGGRPGLPVPNSPCGLCGRKATLNLDLNSETQSSGAVWKSRSPSWAPRP